VVESIPPIAPPRKSKKPSNMPGAHKENSSRTESPVELLHNISQDSGISRSPAQFSNNSSVSLSASMERPSGRSLESHPKQKWRLGELFKR
ncbi:Putative LOC100158772, partial [Caligus rogercresseyi]